MRYIIDRKTNEHERYDGQNYDATKYRIVEADSEGWIDHVGSECPLPDDVLCDTKWNDGQGGPRMAAGHWKWRDPSITHYRPILAEKVQEPEPIPAPQYDPRSVSFNLLDRLKAAHEHAQTIPDLEAELREELGSMGYDLVARSPFVDVPEICFGNIAEPEPAVETPQDMTDWRNWREGDLVECVGEGSVFYPRGAIMKIVTDCSGDFGVADCAGRVLSWADFSNPNFRPAEFRFHSRPSKEKYSHITDALKLATGRPAKGEK